MVVVPLSCDSFRGVSEIVVRYTYNEHGGYPERTIKLHIHGGGVLNSPPGGNHDFGSPFHVEVSECTDRFKRLGR